MKAKKIGFIFNTKNRAAWWFSHVMAPTAIYLDNKIRVYFGAWDDKSISRINFIDLDPANPQNILNVNDREPILDIGEDGMFDENGVFPGHATILDGKVYLYYTGFQLGHKIPHYNFGGLAISDDGSNFIRVSKAPILDRADEGLFVRAGQSIILVDSNYYTVYSAGNDFLKVGGKKRPIYDVFIQSGDNPTTVKDTGTRILSADLDVEHGLGRPQITKLGNKFYIFFTRRILSMKYFIGAAYSYDLLTWTKDNQIFEDIHHSKDGFDSEMIYFPSFLRIDHLNKNYLFYCGNGFGKEGLGFCEIY